MKRRTWLVIGILLGILLLFILLAVFGGPIWVNMGGEPICVQGSLPDLRFYPCPEEIMARTRVIPLP